MKLQYFRKKAGKLRQGNGATNTRASSGPAEAISIEQSRKLAQEKFVKLRGYVTSPVYTEAAPWSRQNRPG